MPKSRVRKKVAYTPPVAVSNRKKYGSPWVGPVMATLFIVAVAWLVIYYLSQGRGPIPGIHAWNLVIGFGFAVAGFALATKWR